MNERINTLDRTAGLAEIHDLLDGIMIGRKMLVRFYCLGPLDSVFAIPALQITDSAYVAHVKIYCIGRVIGNFSDLLVRSIFFFLSTAPVNSMNAAVLKI
jgi:GTP-dependent phosphoenolpyruvate carboxykinase